MIHNILTKYEFSDHLKPLGNVLQKLLEAVLKLNAEDSLF